MTIPFDIILPQVNVLGSTMSYREAGDPQAPVALFLHGNPTSSYIDVYKRQSPIGPLGMGAVSKSAKCRPPHGRY